MSEEDCDVVLCAAAGCPRKYCGGNPGALRLRPPVFSVVDKGKLTGAGGAAVKAEFAAGASSRNPASFFTVGLGMHDVHAS